MTYIPKAQLSLPVRRNADVMDLSSSNGNELWVTERLIVQRINPGDEMTLWPDEEDYDPVSGPLWPVKNVFWDSQGRMQLEMALMILDPSEQVLSAYYAKSRSGWSSDLFARPRIFRREDGEPLEERMYRGGWNTP